MDKWQKEVVQTQLNNEKECLEALKEAYAGALNDVNIKIAELLGREDAGLQNVIYQVQYQEALKKQIETALDNLQSQNFDTVSQYLSDCYEEGYLGTMYNMQKQGIPLVFPIDQAQAVQAITNDTKLSEDLYSSLGKDINKLKKNVASEISRGISTNMTYSQIATAVAMKAGISENNAKRIARTEGHRISSKATMDACNRAKDKGADVVKQWDATLDGRTRESHRNVDGEIRELDETFSNGLMYPSDPNGSARETINCRCVLLERARWAVEAGFTKNDGFGNELLEFNSQKDYEDFKKKYWSDENLQYMKFVEELESKYQTSNEAVLLQNMSKDEFAKLRDLANKTPYFKNKKYASPISSFDRSPVDIEFNAKVSCYNAIKGGCDVRKGGEKYGQEFQIVKVDKRNTTKWDDLPPDTQSTLGYTRYRGKPFNIDKGEYEVQRYVEGSMENAERDEIAKALGGKYIGFAFQNKNGYPLFVDFYQKGDEVFYSVGKAKMEKSITESSLKKIAQVTTDREGAIISQMGNKATKQLMVRSGNEWVESMKEFHRIIQADGLPTILPEAEYDKISSPVLYRGIAPQSSLRRDIKTTLSSTTEMANEFFKGDSPFPSRGVYGDGVAYASPAYKKIALHYATNGGAQPHGGAIIEFKLKEDANVILYEDALNIFREMTKNGGSKLLFEKHQTKARDKEVGKAMNALGYDAIIKHNGDDTGEDFYIILNRASLVSKEKYITKKL